MGNAVPAEGSHGVAIASLDRLRNRRKARGAIPRARIERCSLLKQIVAHRAHVSPVACVHALDASARPRRGLSREGNRARYPRAALVAERRFTYRRMVPLPPMRTEPASFLSFSTSIVASCESTWVRGRAVSRDARVLKGHASVSGGALAIGNRNPLTARCEFSAPGFWSAKTRTCDSGGF